MPRKSAQDQAAPRSRRRNGFTEAFALESETDQAVRRCDHAGCAAGGTYRAPRAPDRLDEHYWFCLDHVREYNKAWNYCAGRSDSEIEAMIRDDVVGWRPTWPLGRLGGRFSRDRFARFKDAFGLFGDEAAAEEAARAGARERARRRREADANGDEARERAALDVMELAPPLTAKTLKARYKELVKRHHPDANGGDKQAEERLKLINQAYATLKQCLGV